MGEEIIQGNFTSGELAPALYGRVDFSRYYASLKTCRNFIVRQYGGVINRAGTYLAGEAHDSLVKGRLIPFVFSSTQSYVLEFGDYVLRIFKDGGVVVWPSGPFVGLPVEVVTPYAVADLPLVKYSQSLDVLTLTHPSYKTQELIRTDHHLWTMQDYVATGGPFEPINIDTTITVQASAVTGDIILTASEDFFLAAHIGMFFYLEQMPNDTTLRWEVDKTVTEGDQRRAGSNYYEALTSGVTGTVRPTILEGKEFDGDPGVSWEYLHSGSGILQITALTSAQVVSATVINRIPTSLITTASYKWAFGAWGESSGYPGAVGYDQERMIFGGALNSPDTFHMSRSQGYKDFGTSNPILDDDSLTYKIKSNELVEIRHFLELSELIVMASSGNFVIRGGQDGVIKPGAISRKKQPSSGCSHIRPLVVNSHAIYVQEKGSQVRSLGYSFQEDAFVGQDLTALSHHLFLGRTIVDWCYQAEPFGCVWVVLDDGKLLSLTYMPEQEVIGWAWHDTDGYFESCACITEDNIDRPYFLVRRTIGGTDYRFIERMAPRLYTDPVDAFFVDCGLTYDGVPADEITGLDHLEGETVSILADGTKHAQQVVTGGKVVLDREASVVHVGLPFVSDFETLDIANAQSPIRSKEKIIPHVSLIVENSRGIWVGPSADRLTEAKREAFNNYTDSIFEQTGLLDLRIQATMSKKGNIFARQVDPLPMSILAVIPEVTFGGS